MTKAIKEATVEDYMTLLRAGDNSKYQAFVNECFGTDQDFNVEACDAFAKLVEAPAQEYIKEQYMNVPTATDEMTAQAGNAAEVAVVDAPALEDAALPSAEQAAQAQEEVTETTEEVAVEAAPEEA
ncbi:MAG: hypothetical protein V3S69_03425 [Dehalococcoidales bacterium]